MNAKHFCMIIFTLVFWTSQTMANWLFDSNDAWSAKAHCPFMGGFRVVVLQPVANNQFMLQCMNATGSSYHTELGQINADSSDPAWIAQKYPRMWVCLGREPEDCGFFKGDR